MKQLAYGIMVMVSLSMIAGFCFAGCSLNQANEVGNVEPDPSNGGSGNNGGDSNTKTRVSFHGTRLRGYPDGNVDVTTNDDAWEKWTWNYLGDNKFTWKSAHGTYLRANPDGRVDLAPEAREWEEWTKESVNGKNAWKSFHGTYLRAYPDGRVDLAPWAQEWETWDD